MATTPGDLTEIAINLLERWRRYLLSTQTKEYARFTPDYSAIQEELEEGLGEYIDIIETLSIERLNESSDQELASTLRLTIEISRLLTIGLAEWEHNFLLDSHSSIMVRMALIMRHRGHRITLPKVKLR
ncbi:hypothetical protein GCM10010411_06720 [Actinomadura fulvescens]|uniref:Uncharacterized protein n=2 Tax=Actinomadura fulvescens TaxID=46160 RepID=A0ABN3PC80_9ACTN